ncbi:MAG: 6-pyruvoyl-tetrahydropterin synthase-related protein [Candidatus Aenigmatarchaeota archaeon]
MSLKGLLVDNKKKLINTIIMITIFSLLLSYYRPDLLLLETTTSGGDMGSHYYPAKYLKNELIPRGQITGWSHGWYAGFPIFQFYFPLPFLLIVLLSNFIPFSISFKIITTLGVFLLPLFSYFSFKLLKYRFPVPIISSTLSLSFLFMEANSMWGGNIASTLAGEFSFSISLSISILFLGSLYRGLKERKYWIHNGILFALIVFSHSITGMVVFFTTIFFLLQKNRKNNLKYLIKTYMLSLLLISFWFLPLIANIGYTSGYAGNWSAKIYEIFPPIISIFFPLTVIGILHGFRNKDKRIFYLLFFVLVAFSFFLLGEKSGVINIRFLPFVQLMLLLIGSTSFLLFRKLKMVELLPVILIIFMVLWVNYNVEFISTWIDWNYKGFENKELWNEYSSVNNYLRGNENYSRVVYEHSGEHDKAGTPRAYESLPLFSGRSTLEGLYMQSSISTPFVFYIQSEISKEQSCPLYREYPCTFTDIERGTEHLKMFNVKHFIAVSDYVKGKLMENNDYELKKTYGIYQIYELKDYNDGYVHVPKRSPVKIDGDWKKVFYEWFQNESLLEIPLVSSKRTENRLEELPKINSLEKIPRTEIKSDCIIREDIKPEIIEFETNCIGKPHIISISYYPNWKVQGADEIYLVSPSFMLVYPEQEHVKLYYGETYVDNVGKVLTFMGLVFLTYRFFSYVKAKI